MKIITLNLWQVFPINMIKKNTTEDQPENPQVTKIYYAPYGMPDLETVGWGGLRRDPGA